MQIWIMIRMIGKVWLAGRGSWAPNLEPINGRSLRKISQSNFNCNHPWNNEIFSRVKIIRKPQTSLAFSNTFNWYYKSRINFLGALNKSLLREFLHVVFKVADNIEIAMYFSIIIWIRIFLWNCWEVLPLKLLRSCWGVFINCYSLCSSISHSNSLKFLWFLDGLGTSPSYLAQYINSMWNFSRVCSLNI